MFRRRPPEPQVQPEWLIVGLGNPGPEYARTRHNVGFEVIEALAARHRIKLATRKHRAVFGWGRIDGVAVVLAKPLTYMNLSGEAVAPLSREIGLKPERIVVIADDLDLDVGRVRMRPKGGAGGHNGHKSLISALGSNEYPRIRIGIGKGDRSTIDHVLSRFSPDERDLVAEAIERSVVGLEALVRDGLERALTLVNAGQPKPGVSEDSDG